tara:strand:+ start:115 stop:1209 length:1095 start_codon:yes stop_codon:yes gene_type:complete
MKINLIIFLAEFHLGGAGNSLFKLCKNLSNKNFSISVICLNKCFYKNELKKYGIKVYEVKSSRTLFAMSKIKSIVKSLISNNKKNIFMSNIYYSNILSILFLRSLNLKIILIERTPFQELSIYYGLKDFFKKFIIKILIRYNYSKADMCIANSYYISREYNNNYKLKFKTIYPPSFNKLNFIKKKKKNKNYTFCIGTVCRLSKEKNLDELIKIIPKLDKNVILKIVGDGPEYNKLKELTLNLNIEKQIKFLGKFKPNKVKSIIKTFNIFVNCSDFEGFPNSVVEAIASGVPVIASQSYGGINEILNSKSFGFIYKDRIELKNILEKIIRKKINFKLKKSKILKHLNNFSEINNLKKYKNIFYSI